MLEIKNVSVYNLDHAVKASGYPMRVGDPDDCDISFKRGSKLGSCLSGLGHDNFLTGILVSFDVKFPQYWSMEMERYHFAQIISSQSKMHCLVKAMNDTDSRKCFNKYVDSRVVNIIGEYVEYYNDLLKNEKSSSDDLYKAYMKVLSNLPMGYEMWMAMTTNYAQLKTIYNQRKDHKLKEDWGEFCNWILTLPHFCELTGIKSIDKN